MNEKFIKIILSKELTLAYRLFSPLALVNETILGGKNKSEDPYGIDLIEFKNSILFFLTPLTPFKGIVLIEVINSKNIFKQNQRR